MKENEPLEKAKEKLRQLEEENQRRGRSGDFSIYEVPNGTLAGTEYVQKEKPDGSVTLYPVET